MAIVVGCAPAGDVRVAGPVGEIQAPQFDVVPGRTSIERFDPPGTGTGLELTVGAQLRNPNDFGITVDEIAYRVSLTDTEVASGVLQDTIYLGPGATAPVRFDVSTDLDRRPSLLRAILRAFADEPLPFRIHGRVSFASSSYAFQTRDRLLLQGSTLARQTLAQPELALDEAESRVYNLRPGVPVVHLVVHVTNPGDIGYFLYGRDLQLALGGSVIGREDLSPAPIPARQSTRVDILFFPVPQNLESRGATALDAALAGIPTLVQLSGELKLDVLGVDTFDVTPARVIRGFVDADR